MIANEDEAISTPNGMCERCTVDVHYVMQEIREKIVEYLHLHLHLHLPVPVPLPLSVPRLLQLLRCEVIRVIALTLHESFRASGSVL